MQLVSPSVFFLSYNSIRTLTALCLIHPQLDPELCEAKDYVLFSFAGPTYTAVLYISDLLAFPDPRDEMAFPPTPSLSQASS
jgi:hypothetical protein